MKLSKNDRRARIHNRIRKIVSGTAERPRLAVFRSNKEIYAQIIDDVKGRTLFSASTVDTKVSAGKSSRDGAFEIGKKIEINLEKIQKIYQITDIRLSDNKKTTGTVRILHDISREKTISRIKSEFISIAAHQLRTPLSAIKWTFRMIIDEDVGKISDEQKVFLERGYETNERMIKLVSDLLNVSRIEEGRFGYEFIPFSIQKYEKRPQNKGG